MSKPRGYEVALPHGGLPEQFGPYLASLIEQTGGINGPIGLQYVARPDLELLHAAEGLDPFEENKYIVAPRLVYKFDGEVINGKVERNGRGLWMVNLKCGAYCRFCFRGREVGQRNHGLLTYEQIDQTLEYIATHPELNEIIVSGGDPFAAPLEYQQYIVSGLAKLQRDGQLDIVRWGTRMPFQNPAAVSLEMLENLEQLDNVRVMLHINHPAELTVDSLALLKAMRKQYGLQLYNQTVLLTGVNDNPETLIQLCNDLYKNSVNIYRVYTCDPVGWAKHFAVDWESTQQIMEAMQGQLSGLAMPQFIIERGFDKTIIPARNRWNFDQTHFQDSQGQEHQIDL